MNCSCSKGLGRVRIFSSMLKHKFILSLISFSLFYLLLLGTEWTLVKAHRSSRLEVVQNLNLNGVKAFPLFSGWIYLNEIVKVKGPLDFERLSFLPLAGISEVTTVYCKEAGEHLIYKSDEFGFTTPKAYGAKRFF